MPAEKELFQYIDAVVFMAYVSAVEDLNGILIAILAEYAAALTEKHLPKDLPHSYSIVTSGMQVIYKVEQFFVQPRLDNS